MDPRTVDVLIASGYGYTDYRTLRPVLAKRVYVQEYETREGKLCAQRPSPPRWVKMHRVLVARTGRYVPVTVLLSGYRIRRDWELLPNPERSA